MKIVIEVIPHSEQRYPTAGDWYWEQTNDTAMPQYIEGNVLHIKVSNTYSANQSFLLIIHELVEAFGCAARGISQEKIDEWDINFEGEGEPGDHSEAPYHTEHTFATAIERMVAELIYENWVDYDKAVNALFSDLPPEAYPQHLDDDIPF